MKKGLIICTVIVTLFSFVGCTNTNIDKSKEPIVIENMGMNNEEILGKTYEELKMIAGEPYVSSYYIEADKDNAYIELGNILDSIYLQLVYPTNSKDKPGALYIELENNKVVNSYYGEFEGTTNGFDSKNANISTTDIVIDYYETQRSINSNKIDIGELQNYVGKNISNLNKKLGVTNANFEAYNKDNSKKFNFYLITEESNDVLFVRESNNIIKEISIIDDIVVEDMINLYLK